MAKCMVVIQTANGYIVAPTGDDQIKTIDLDTVQVAQRVSGSSYSRSDDTVADILKEAFEPRAEAA